MTDKLTYQWFRRNEEGDGEEIEGNKDKASLKVENITKNAEYYCRVSDGNEEQYVNFNLKIDSGLKIDYSATASKTTGIGVIVITKYNADDTVLPAETLTMKLAQIEKYN